MSNIDIKALLLKMLDAMYPIGAIYISTNSTDPGTLIGGSWTRIENKFLLASGSTYAAGTTGGSADAVVPYHNHSVSAVANSITGGGHTHPPEATGYRFLSYNYSTVSTGCGETQVATGSSGRYVPSVAKSNVDFAGHGNTGSQTHTHNLPAHNTNYAGTSGNTTNANMPPYLAVYVWERTA